MIFLRIRGGMFNLEPFGGNGKSFGRNSKWAEHHFWKSCFLLHGQEKHPKTHAIPSCVHVSPSLMFCKKRRTFCWWIMDSFIHLFSFKHADSRRKPLKVSSFMFLFFPVSIVLFPPSRFPFLSIVFVNAHTHKSCFLLWTDKTSKKISIMWLY